MGVCNGGWVVCRGAAHQRSIECRLPTLRNSSTQIADPILGVVPLSSPPNSGGARCWVSMQDVYKAAGLSGQAGNGSKWVQNKLASWEKFLTSFGLPLPHLRRGMPTALSADGGKSWRVLPYSTLSSSALLAIVANLSTGVRNYGGMTNEQELRKCQTLLGHLLAWACPGEVALRLNCDLSPQCIDGTPIGLHPVFIPIANGLVCLAPLRIEFADLDSNFRSAVIRSTCDIDQLLQHDAVSVSDFVVFLLRGGP